MSDILLQTCEISNSVRFRDPKVKDPANGRERPRTVDDACGAGPHRFPDVRDH